MWSDSSRDRVGRVVAAIKQAASLGTAVAMLAPIAVAAAAVVSGFLLGHPWIGAFAGGALSMVLLQAALLMFPLHGVMRRLFWGLRFRDVRVTIEIDRHGERRHRRRTEFDVQIVRTGIRKVPDRYCAPGPRGTQTDEPRHAPKVVSGNARALGVLYDHNDECWLYEMDLGAPLGAGALCNLAVEQELDFSGVGYEPRVQRTILDPTDHLELRLNVPDGCWPVKAVGEEILNGDRRKSLELEIDDAHREVRLEVNEPRFGSIYRIRWEPAHQTWRVPITLATDLPEFTPAPS
jgi:hypothetical protein